MKLLKTVLCMALVFTLIVPSATFAASAPKNMFLDSAVALELKTNPYLVVKTEYLEAGNYSVEYKDSKLIKKVMILDEMGDLRSYATPKTLPQRDIFAINTFTSEVEITAAGNYSVITVLTKKADAIPVFHKFTKRTSAMNKEDLHTWSASYTDNTRVEVTNNGATYVNMAKYAPEIVSFSQVSTKLNRTFTVLDGEDLIIQRKDFADILIKVNAELMKSGYRLLIYDGYRTKESTGKLLQYTLDDIKKPLAQREYLEIDSSNWGQFVVIPNGKSDKHGKGTASDVSLVNMKTGEIINMPSRVNTMDKTATIVYTKNRSNEYTLLLNAMKKFGAIPLNNEWYHFSHVAKPEFNFPTDLLRKNFYPNKVTNSVPASWATADIDWMKKAGLVPQSLLKDLKRAITKEEFTILGMNIIEKQVKENIEIPKIGFSDTNLVQLKKAKALGIVSGNSGKFGPSVSLTREQTASIVSNIYKKLYPLLIIEELPPEIPTEMPAVDTLEPPDDSEVALEVLPEAIVVEKAPRIALSEVISGWAKDDVAFVLENGIMTFDAANKFNPYNYLSVEEAIVLLYKVMHIQEVAKLK